MPDRFCVKKYSESANQIFPIFRKPYFFRKLPVDYIQLICKCSAEEAEIIIAGLSELDFESFQEKEGELNAYIPAKDFEPEKVNNYFIQKNHIYETKLIPAQNWNVVWENNFQPVMIDGKCFVRAPFHKKNTIASFEIVIEPKMSFGTAHHETTSMMISCLLEQNVEGKSVLDMGCGTAVLAILAAMKGAKKITAVDIDEWAVNNATENAANNNCQHIEVIKGGKEQLVDKNFDLILANINRNVLINDMPDYTRVLNNNGTIFFSGFYLDDLKIISQTAFKNGLKFVSFVTKNNWTAAQFLKK